MSIHARSPGKLILSGEHSAVYGQPALAMAVNRFADTFVRRVAEPGIGFDLDGLDFHLRYSPLELESLYTARLQAYEAFQRGGLPIQEVLPRPVELIPFAFAQVWTQAGRPACEGLRIRQEIGIPIGCGMGSSAAVGLSMIQAAARYFHQELSAQRVFELSLQCERLMHGHPSGVDSHVCLNGGMVRFKAGQVEPRSAPEWEFLLVNTGRPASSTGECVETVGARFRGSSIWQEFSAITTALDAHASQPLDARLIELIRANHRLLCRIGVVPERVQALIRAIEEQGGAAKICGAGAVRGDGGGVALVVGDVRLHELCQQFQANRILCRPEPGGTRCEE